ncbi:MAG: hypothetical protein AAF682_05695 [Planctomycetota bacterium]
MKLHPLALSLALAPATLASGQTIGPTNFQISDMDAGGFVAVWDTGLAFNSAHDEYLVAWTVNSAEALGEREIYGQRLLAGTDTLVGEPSFRISDRAADGESTYHDLAPSVTYNSVDDEYLVLWIRRTLVSDSWSVHAQRIDGATASRSALPGLSSPTRWTW